MATIEVIGWVGTFLILLAYGLVSWGKIKSNRACYQLMNVFGAVLLGTDLFTKMAWPAFTLQCIWALIALIALWKMTKTTN